MMHNPVAVARHIDNLAAMNEAIKDGSRDGGIAEEVGPFIKAFI